MTTTTSTTPATKFMAADKPYNVPDAINFAKAALQGYLPDSMVVPGGTTTSYTAPWLSLWWNPVRNFYVLSYQWGGTQKIATHSDFTTALANALAYYSRCGAGSRLSVSVKVEDAAEAAACPDLFVENDANRDASRAGWWTWAHAEAPHVAHAARVSMNYTNCLLYAKTREEYLELCEKMRRQIWGR